MTIGTIDDSVHRIEVGHTDFNDLLLLCGEFAKAHGFSMKDNEVFRIRQAGVSEIKSQDGFKYILQGDHELNLRLEDGMLLISYKCPRGSIKLFDDYVEHYKNIARQHRDSMHRLNAHNLLI